MVLGKGMMQMDQKMKYTRELYMLQTKLTVLDKKRKMITSQLSTTHKALDELHITDEKKVYKIIGNILIQKDVDSVINELSEKKEMMAAELRETEKQIENNLNKFKALGANYSDEAVLNQNDYTLDTDHGSIFDISNIIKNDDA